MSEKHDRVAMVSDLTAAVKQLEKRISDESGSLEKRLEKRISEEGALTRTHFNVMVERVESAVKLVAEVNSHHSTILDDHEARLQKTERR
jgi:methyl-accepting chemotaxis protein